MRNNGHDKRKANASRPQPICSHSLQDAAIQADVCEKTLYREIKRNKLRAHKVGRQWRINHHTLLAYLGVPPSGA